jgi:transcriptional regulator with XRE-family HTH domain
MTEPNDPRYIEKARAHVARKVQKLRKERHWTQAELARRLQLSQSRLSEIERGDGSFTAEQFLTILKLFNVTASDFAPEPRGGQESKLQNALARLGALHIQESTATVPSELLNDVSDVVRETIVASQSPRLIAALGPVLVANIDRINLKKLHFQLTEAGLGQRLAWLVENTVEAIRRELPRASPAPWRRVYSRAQVVLRSFLDFLTSGSQEEASVPDVLDPSIRSKQTLAEVTAASSAISHRWGIVTTLQPEDFAEALRAARASGR